MMNANPSVDPANLDSLTGTLKHVFKKLLQSVGGMLPCKVINISSDNKTAQVQPLIAIVSTAGQQMSRAQIANVPILQIGGGGFIMRFPIKTGDLGWIIASDRDISLFLQSYSEQVPNTYRIKDFADSLFIPNVLTGYTIADEDSANAVLQSLDGTVKISFGNAQIKIAAPTVIVEATDATIDATTVEITSPTVTVNASTGMNVTTPTLAVTGNITATGTITPGV